MSDAGASVTNIGNSINAYKLELPNDNNILPTSNVKDLRLYHGEDSRASLFSQLWGIDTGVFTTNIGNLIFIMENSDLGGFGTLGDTKYISISKYFESCYYFDLELFYFRKICFPSQSSGCFI